MGGSTGEFPPQDGAMLWPRDRADLISADRCPACFTVLVSTSCGRCGLDLATPLSVDLLDASLAAADALDRRAAVLTRMRREADAAARVGAQAREAASEFEGQRREPVAERVLTPPGPRPAAAVRPVEGAGFPAADPTSAAVHAADPTSAVLGPAAPNPAVPAPAAPTHAALPPTAPTVRRGSSVQVILLIVGVSLLSVGAVAFLVYAFINYGLLWRSVIIAAVTVAAFTLSTVLSRRKLRATAEGLAVFAMVLVYLDAYAVRANDFFSAASVDGTLYWGATSALAAVGFMLWQRGSGLRAPSLIGYSTFAPAAALLAAGVTEGALGDVRVYAAFTTMASAALIHLVIARATGGAQPVAGRHVERGLVLGTAVVAIAVAGAVSPFFRGLGSSGGGSDSRVPAGSPVDWVELGYAVLPLAGVALVAALHVAAIIRSPAGLAGRRGWIALFAIAVAIALSVVGFPAALRALEVEAVAIVPAIIAVAVALGFEFAYRRWRGAGRGPDLGLAAFAAAVAAITSGVIAVLAIAIPALVAGATAALFPARTLATMLTAPLDERLFEFDDVVPLSVTALAIVGGLITVAWLVGGLLRRRAGIVAGYGAAVAFLAVPLLEILGLVVGGWLALAVAALVTLLRARGRARLAWARPALLGLVVVGTTAGYVLGGVGSTTWIVAAVVALAIVLGSRSLLAPSGATVAPEALPQPTPDGGNGSGGALLTRTRGRAALAGTALAILLIAAATTARQLEPLVGGGSGAEVDLADSAEWGPGALRFAGLIAAVIATACAARLPVAGSLDRRVVLAGAAAVAVVASAVGRMPAPASVFDGVVVHLTADATLLAGGVIWATVGSAWVTAALSTKPGSGRSSAGVVTFGAERIAASVLLAPFSWLLADSVVRATGFSRGAVELAPALAALLVAVVSLGFVLRGRGRRLHRAREVGIVAVTAAALVGGLVARSGFAGTGADAASTVWLVVLLAAMTLLVVSVQQPRGAASAVLVGVSAALVPLGAAEGMRELVGAATSADAARIAASAAVLLLATSALHLGRVADSLDRRVLFWVSFVIAGCTSAALTLGPSARVDGPIGGGPGVLAGSALALCLSAGLTAALVLVAGSRATRLFRWERIAASIAIGPALYLLVDSFARVVGAPELIRSVAPVTAALLASAASLAVTLLRPTGVSRPAREIGVALVGVPAIGASLASPDGSTWLTLLLGGIAALLVAVSADGIFASRSRRRHVGWLALSLAVAGLWWRLVDDAVTDVEAYVLPVAGLLLLVALLVWRAGARRASNEQLDRSAVQLDRPTAQHDRSAVQLDRAAVQPDGPTAQPDRPTAQPDRPAVTSAHPRGGPDATRPRPALTGAAPLLWIAGLLVAVLPIAATAAGDAAGGPAGGADAGGADAALLALGIPARPILIATASVLLLLAGCFLPSRRRGVRPYLDGAALVGAIGLIVAAVGRAIVIAADRPADGEIDVWLAVAVTVLIVAAFGLARVIPDELARQRALAGLVLAVIAIGCAALIEAWAIARSGESLLRALAVMLALSAVHVLAFLVDRPPLTRVVAWIAIAFAALVGAVSVSVSVLDPVELATAPVALALLATGATHLRERADSRSWPWLGPGVAVLLLPSLVVSTLAGADERPLWRLVGLGVVGIAVLVIAVVRRLQAPFALAAVVLLIHAGATFAPQVRSVYEAVEWWLWLVVGGVVLIALALRYEQRLKNLKSAVGRFSALR